MGSHACRDSQRGGRLRRLDSLADAGAVALLWFLGEAPRAEPRPVRLSAAPVAGVLQVRAGGLLLGLTLVWRVTLQRTRFRHLDVGVAARASERAAVRQ